MLSKPPDKFIHAVTDQERLFASKTAVKRRGEEPATRGTTVIRLPIILYLESGSRNLHGRADQAQRLCQQGLCFGEHEMLSQSGASVV